MTPIIPPDQMKIQTVWSTDSEQHRQTERGQHCGMPRITRAEHLPTGTVVYIADARSQFYQRKVAIDALEFILTHPDFRS